MKMLNQIPIELMCYNKYYERDISLSDEFSIEYKYV